MHSIYITALYEWLNKILLSLVELLAGDPIVQRACLGGRELKPLTWSHVDCRDSKGELGPVRHVRPGRAVLRSDERKLAEMSCAETIQLR